MVQGPPQSHRELEASMSYMYPIYSNQNVFGSGHPWSPPGLTLSPAAVCIYVCEVVETFFKGLSRSILVSNSFTCVAQGTY